MTKTQTKRKLTALQQLFVSEYLIDLNATQAAIRAGYSAKNADKIGPKLVGNSRDFTEIRKAWISGQKGLRSMLMTSYTITCYIDQVTITATGYRWNSWLAGSHNRAQTNG